MKNTMQKKKFKKPGDYLSILCCEIIICCLLLTACCLLPASAFAVEGIVISADHLEYIAETNTYFAKGSVKITYEDMTLNADEINLNNSTAEAVATGSVVYEDTELKIEADRIELNLNTKLGTLYQSKIFHKDRNYHIKGNTLKRLGKDIYFIDRATATTCDAIPPEWHFKAEDIKITMRENVKAENTTFYIKNVPVFYSPYFGAPLERQTGLLTPAIGHSSSKGFTFKQGFFWAMKDNMDATFYADYYSEKGIGKGIDYRYILSPDADGELWMYHLRDNDLLRDFFELKSYHNQRLPYDMSAYLKMHFVNEFDYYNVLESTSSKRIGLLTQESDPFGFSSEERLQKYLESNLHISKPFGGRNDSFPSGRTYLLGQYRQALGSSSGAIPQSLPEIGFIIYTGNLGRAFFNVSAAGTNFWRDVEQQGQRIDIYPNLYFSLGRTINFTQKIGLRETAYFLENPAQNETRELFDISSTLTTRLLKRYTSFIHVVEPSVEYIYIPAVDHSNIPAFDSTDSIPQTSRIAYSLRNRLMGSAMGGLEARLRISQYYSMLNVDAEKPFSPVLMETTMSSGSLNFSANASYDIYDKNITETIASVSYNWEKGFVSAGKNLRRSTFLDQYTFEAGLNKPVEIFNRSLPLDILGKVRYDMKGGGVQELNLKTIYSQQCWSMTVSFTRTPYEYQVMVGINFMGFGSIKI